MTNRWIVLMVLLPLLTGVLSTPIVARLRLSRVLGVVGLSATLIAGLLLLNNATSEQAGGILVSQMGGWAAPYGISLVFDTFSGLMLCAAAAVTLCGYVAALGTLDRTVERRYFHPLMHFMLAGVNLSFLTGDLFNLFVAFEIMLMASYGLLCLAGGEAQLRQAYKYVLLNLLASALFVIAAGLVYGMFGTLNLADLMRIVRETSEQGEALPTGFTAVSVVLLTVFGLKAAIFPLWFWLPDAYPTMPVPLLAVFGGVLTKVGVYVIARTFPPIFAAGEAAEVIVPILLTAAALTMVLGAIMAVAYRRLRAVLCMFVIVGVGFALAGVAVGGETGLAGAAFYMTQSMIVAALSFLVCGQIENRVGSDDIDDAGQFSWYRAAPWLAVVGFVLAMTLVGLPPLSGFYGKLWVVQAAFTGPDETPGHSVWWLGLAGLVAGTITLLAALRWWTGVFWLGREDQTEEPPATQPASTGPRSLTLAVALLLAASLWMGVAAEPVLALAKDAGTNLADPQRYITAVLQPETTEPSYASTHGTTTPANDQAHRASPSTPEHHAQDSTPPATHADDRFGPNHPIRLRGGH